ncbi:MAG: acylphosphatase [Bacteroidetes bacterium QH_2_67_10]|nr:MAG: acylphosphatase [Bacteroidetes bacterium QH_2_67_10]PSQ76271.1 MAG: acylphosphatase [Bacteroidetes bacterium QH_8_67_23]
MSTAERLSAQVTGRVQGVGFRQFTRRKASDLDLTGWVKNEPDGSVRLEAEGPRDALDDLVDALRRGPRTASVENVSADWQDADGRFDRFQVRY